MRLKKKLLPAALTMVAFTLGLCGCNSAKTSSDARIVTLENPYGRVAIDLVGARILSWRMADKEMFFMPSNPQSPDGDWSHGGLSICWPWFGKKGTAASSIHGFARNKTFTMGSFSEYYRDAAREPSHTATLTNDFYIAVFETTQAQWRQFGGALPSYFMHEGYRVMRPVEKVSYNDIRISADNNYYAVNDFPNQPYESYWLGLLRTRTGIDFDLPGEAQWEFACRAGHGEGEWGNGRTYTTSDLTIARHLASAGGNQSPPNMCDTTLGTATCGSYPPNDWGLYDMHGNLSEWCLDWYVDGVDLDYQVNIDPTNPANRLDTNVEGTQKSRRGGSWTHTIDAARSAARNRDGAGTRWNAIGFRVICPVEAN